MARASWLYHVEGLTQAQIAERMFLTRRKVNELLAAALDTGVVRISFNSPLAENVELEARLRQLYGLQDVVIVPKPTDDAHLPVALGRATAMFLDHRIAAMEPASIGVGWGATLAQVTQHMSPTNAQSIKIRSMMGGLTRGSEINTFEIVRRFARALNAQCHYFAAPIYTDDAVSRDTIVSQAIFRDLLRDAAAVDISVLSVGDISSRSLQVRYGLPAGIDISDLIAAGAVGDLLGRYLDGEGRQIDHSLNRQVISPELEDYAGIPTRIITSGRIHKRNILRACLTAGLATVVITDDDTASWLLGHHGGGKTGAESAGSLLSGA
jgi:DNA-binding transcriptional regulator LsrR (DeoR family)